MARGTKIPPSVRTAWQSVDLILAAALFFFTACLCSAATIKSTAILLILLTLSAVFLFYEKVRDRVKLPIVALGLVVLMDGLSNLYAVSGKYALYEFLKVLAAFCLAILFLAFTGERDPGRQAAVVLEGCAAIAGLVSIDLLSTRYISTPVLAFLELFTPDYTDLNVVEEGVRITSVFMNPNVFAGCMGIGVLLSLGLAVYTEKKAARAVHLVCLSINSLAFMLAFSMGACVMIVPAFLVFLAFESRERRASLLLLMLETLTVTLLATFPISLTSMTAWDGVRPIPLLCTIGAAAALCVLDLFVGRRAAARLSEHGKAVLCLVGAVLAAVVVFAVVACNWTTGVSLQAGETLRRSSYPAPGTYALTAQADGEVSVVIESQDRAATMMHTSTQLYAGPLSQAEFTVPEGSLVVYFNFRADGQSRLESVAYEGEGGAGAIPLGYKLLPSFVANRLQGLFANQNAIQRFVFFEDGLKLFRRSPVIGLGLGAFENGVRSVQTFHYATKYAHNHYIQTMAETGIVGLVLLLGLLAVSAVAVWRGRKQPLVPALAAALAFMVGHGAVELVFSAYPYLPMAFGVFAIIDLCCGSAVPVPAWMGKQSFRTGATLSASALMVVFGVMLGCNMTAQSIAVQAGTLPELEEAMGLDLFERADYMLTYVVWATEPDLDAETQQKANGYAERLAKIHSNTIPIRLAEYYLVTGQIPKAMEMAEQYVDYVSSANAAWQDTFDLLERYEQDTEVYRAGVTHIAELMEAWNRENLGQIDVDAETWAFIERMRT